MMIAHDTQFTYTYSGRTGLCDVKQFMNTQGARTIIVTEPVDNQRLLMNEGIVNTITGISDIAMRLSSEWEWTHFIHYIPDTVDEIAEIEIVTFDEWYCPMWQVLGCYLEQLEALYLECPFPYWQIL